MSKRIEWLHALARLITGRQWDACPDMLYRVLYGLPSERLLSFTVDTLKRYLPVFEQHWPGTTWPRQLLDNPAIGIQQFGRKVPGEPSPDDLGDAGYLFCFDALLLGWVYRQQIGILTSSSACAILEAIEAHTQTQADEHLGQIETAIEAIARLPEVARQMLAVEVIVGAVQAVSDVAEDGIELLELRDCHATVAGAGD